MTARPDAPATRRNKDAILEVLLFEFRDRQSVFEIGSGTGQHAVYFAAALPWLVWHPSDLRENHDGISAWVESASLPNLKSPADFNVACEKSFDFYFDAVFSANTAHIMSLHEVVSMFTHVSKMLNCSGVFCLYGPFNENGRFTSDSNAAFDTSLRERDSSMGIRDRDELNRISRDVGLLPVRRYAMPANNQILVWEKPIGQAV